MPRLALLALPLLLTGCFLYPDDKVCALDYAEGAPQQIVEQRDPDSGSCQALSGGGGYGGHTGCDDNWGGPSDLEQAPVDAIDWALCYQQCEGLDEATCLGSSACRAAYIEESGGGMSFYECWGTAPSGPVQGGDCTGLDAYECSRHDDCSALHGRLESLDNDRLSENGLGSFVSCLDESGMQGCYYDSDCDSGFHCNADTECLEAPGCSSDGDSFGEPCAECYGFCEPDVAPNPGSCTGDVWCEEDAPNCPTGTVPGIIEGCWSGYCIPTSYCQSVAECPSLGESACVARSDCKAVFQGVDCSCNGESCTCADWVFESCYAQIDSQPAWP